MDRLHQLPFFVAFAVALAAMPLDIFQFNQREVGTAKISPWQRKLTGLVVNAIAPLTRFLAFLRSPGVWRVGLAAAVLLLMATGHLHASGFAVVGLTDAKEIREQINKLGTDMLAITAKAKDENRSKLTDDETRSFDKMDTDRNVLIEDERRALRVAELEGGTGRQVEPRQPSSEQRSQGGTAVSTDRVQLAADHEDTLRGWFASQLGLQPSKRQQELSRKFGISYGAREINIRRPKEGMRSLAPADVERWEKRSLATLDRWEEQRAMSTLTPTSPEDGSYLIANEAMQPLERAMLAYGGVRDVSTVLRTKTGANLPIPTSDDTSNEGALLAENTIAVEKDTEFGQLVLGAFKFTSKKVLISRELFQDSNEDLGAFMFTALGERLARAVNRYATTGSGSSQPNGIVTAATASGVALAAKTPTYLELVATEASVDPAYRSGAGWMFHDTELQEIKKIVETTTGRPIWLPNMAGGAPDTILGYKYTINQHMDVASATGSGKSILFGQLKKYLFREVQDITVMKLEELYAEYYQVAFVGFARMDGDLLDAGTHPVKYTANHS